MCQSSSKYVHPSTNPDQVPHSPDSESSKQQHSRTIEYYPAAHFRRGGGHYPPVASDPYTVLQGTSTPTGQTSAQSTIHKRIGYSIGPTSGVPVAPAGAPQSVIYATNTSVATPKSRCSSRISLPAGKQAFSDLESGNRHPMTSEGNNNSSQHRSMSTRAYNRHYNDCPTMANSNSNSALNFGSNAQLGSSSAGKVPVSSISGTGNNHRQVKQQSSYSMQQQQYNNNNVESKNNHSSLGKGGSILRLNGSRVLLNDSGNSRQQYPSANGHMNSNSLASQSNSCSDLVLRDVAATNSAVRRVRSGSSMRSMGKLSQYSISLEDDTTNSVGALT